MAVLPTPITNRSAPRRRRTTVWTLRTAERTSRAGITPAGTRLILERICDALEDTAKEIRSYIKQHPKFQDVGQGMLQEWEKGISSLRI